jgi:hypothetical protein
MTHLLPDELKTWFEQGRATDRDRVIGHLAECEACRKALSALAITAEAADAAPAITVAEAVRAGYAARQPATAGSWGAWLRPAYALAGAAVLVLAMLWVTTPSRTGDDNVVRGSELMAVAPIGPTSSLEFTWASPFDVPRYRVVIRDAGGALVYSGETTTSRLVIDAASGGKFATMVEYSWTVSALDAAGEVVAESKPSGFLYQP